MPIINLGIKGSFGNVSVLVLRHLLRKVLICDQKIFSIYYIQEHVKLMASKVWSWCNW